MQDRCTMEFHGGGTLNLSRARDGGNKLEPNEEAAALFTSYEFLWAAGFGFPFFLDPFAEFMKPFDDEGIDLLEGDFSEKKDAPILWDYET